MKSGLHEFKIQLNPDKVKTLGPQKIVDFKQGWLYPISREEKQVLLKIGVAL